MASSNPATVALGWRNISNPRTCSSAFAQPEASQDGSEIGDEDELRYRHRVLRRQAGQGLALAVIGAVGAVGAVGAGPELQRVTADQDGRQRERQGQTGRPARAPSRGAKDAGAVICRSMYMIS